jgi:hypothetical protein
MPEYRALGVEAAVKSTAADDARVRGFFIGMAMKANSKQ